MVSNNYIMSGGSDYTMLGELPKYGEAGGELETVQAYLETCIETGTLLKYAGLQDRILMRSSGYEPKDYTASILITDESGSALADRELSYRVDGGERHNGTTDKDGMLQITLSDGAHGVRLADTQQEIYIDNYSGFGIVTDQYRPQAALTFLADGSCDPVPGETEEDPDGYEDQDGLTDDEQTSENPEKDPNSGDESVTPVPKTGDDFTSASAAAFTMLGAAILLCAARKRKGRR